MQYSIAEVELQLQEAAKVCEETQMKEKGQQERVATLKEQVQSLKGESKYIKQQHEEATQKFAAQGGLSRDALGRGLKNMDEALHEQTLGDLKQKGESHAVWNGVDFIEGAEGAAFDPLRTDDIKLLKKEVQKLTQENKDFALELDKTETLLSLQMDI